MTETGFVGMEDDDVVRKRGVYANASVTTIMRTRVYFDLGVFGEFVDVSGSFCWRGRSPGGDRISMGVFVPREFVGRTVGGGAEGTRRKVGVRSTRRSTNAFGNVGVGFFGGTTMVPIGSDTTNVWGRQVGHERVRRGETRWGLSAGNGGRRLCGEDRVERDVGKPDSFVRERR